MFKNQLLLIAAFILSLPFTGDAQVIVNRDADIARMVNEISRENMTRYLDSLVSFHSRNNLVPKDSLGKGIWAAMAWAKRELDQYVPRSEGRLRVDLQIYQTPGGGRIQQKIDLPNVVATLQGTDPSDDRILIVSAHMDSRVETHDNNTLPAPGANDDGSGVIAILEMVRLCSERSYPGTIVFTLVSAEEQGLLGAHHIADLAQKEQWNVVAMLNNDMIGNSSSSGTLLNDNMRVRVFSEGIPVVESAEQAAARKVTSAENDSPSRQLARYIKEVGERYVDQMEVALIYRSDRFRRGGDHAAFAQKGYTAVRLTEFNENYDRTHKTPRIENGIQYGDVISGVDVEYVRKNAGVNLATLTNLASAPKAPEQVGILVEGLSNSTKLTWNAPTGGKKPAGYYVLMRESCMPMWQKKIFVPGCSVELPYSKDNYHFAVQSVDDQGHESLAIFPVAVERLK